MHPDDIRDAFRSTYGPGIGDKRVATVEIPNGKGVLLKGVSDNETWERLKRRFLDEFAAKR